MNIFKRVYKAIKRTQINMRLERIKQLIYTNNVGEFITATDLGKETLLIQNGHIYVCPQHIDHEYIQELFITALCIQTRFSNARLNRIVNDDKVINFTELRNRLRERDRERAL